MYATRTTVIAVLCLMLCLIFAVTPGLCQDMDETYQMVIRGLEQRQKLATSVSGLAVEEHLRSEAYWKTRQRVRAGILQKLREQHEAATGRPLSASESDAVPWSYEYARGSFLVRFDLGQKDWEYEAQALIWPGDYTDWGLGSDLTQSPTEAYPFYSHTVCRDGIAYSLHRGTDVPRGDISKVWLERPGPLQMPFCTWLSLSLGWIAWPDRLRDDRFQLVSIEEEVLGEWECQHIVRVLDAEDTFSEHHVWIAPDADWAVVRSESLQIEKGDPTRGIRTVHTWGDFEDVDGVAWLPNTYRRDDYVYGRGGDTPWVESRRIRAREIRCERNPHPTPFPVGAEIRISGEIDPDVDLGHLGDQGTGSSVWREAQQSLIDEPLPPYDDDFMEANAEYLQELDGSELSEMMERAGL